MSLTPEEKLIRDEYLARVSDPIVDPLTGELPFSTDDLNEFIDMSEADQRAALRAFALEQKTAKEAAIASLETKITAIWAEIDAYDAIVEVTPK